MDRAAVTYSFRHRVLSVNRNSTMDHSTDRSSAGSSDDIVSAACCARSTEDGVNKPSTNAGAE